MAKRKFHMKQANMSGKDWMGLSFRHYIDTGKSLYDLSDPIISGVCGDEVEYGRLFAYLFRRFGYPERGWDNYKELVSYRLTTPHPDMVLRITPYVGNNSVITMDFMIEDKIFFAIEDYARRYRTAWGQRSLDFAEQRGLPEWMSEWVEIFNTEFREVFPDAPFADNWRQAVDFHFHHGEKGSRPYALTDRVIQFCKSLHEDYAQVEPWPAYYMRPADVRDWNDDDPLKPFVPAAIQSLEDLRTPVGIRDESINAFGKIKSGRADVKSAPSAGYPSGALGNTAAKEFAELHGLVLTIGKGNAKRGIKKIMSAMGAAVVGGPNRRPTV